MVISGDGLSPMQPMDKPNWKEDHLEQLKKNGVDFVVPIEIRFYKNKNGMAFGNVLLACNHLNESGRCSIYDERPLFCREYIEKSDGLCAEFCGPPNIYPNGTE